MDTQNSNTPNQAQANAAIWDGFDEEFVKLMEEAIKKNSFQLEEKFAEDIALLQKALGDKINIANLIEDELVRVISLGLLLHVSEVLTEEDKKNLQHAFDTGLNAEQQQILTAKLYEARTGETYDDYIARKYEEGIKGFIKEINVAKEAIRELDKLSDEQTEVLNKLATKGYLEDADNLVKVLANGIPADKDDYVPFEMDTETYTALRDALIKNDLTAANKIADELPEFSFVN